MEKDWKTPPGCSRRVIVLDCQTLSGWQFEARFDTGADVCCFTPTVARHICGEFKQLVHLRAFDGYCTVGHRTYEGLVSIEGYAAVPLEYVSLPHTAINHLGLNIMEYFDVLLTGKRITIERSD